MSSRMPSDPNHDSAVELGWDPTWFGLDPGEWGVHLCRAIEEAQAAYDCELTGVMSEYLWRRLSCERMLADTDPVEPLPETSDVIIVDGQECPISWPWVTTWHDEGGRQIERTYKRGGKTRSRYRRRPRAVQGMIEDQVMRAVLHWTVTPTPQKSWSSAWGAKRSVSTHFEIGAEGVIYQWLDVKHAAYHAGVTWANDCGIGVDLTSPVGQRDPEKALAQLLEAGQPEREIMDGWRINGWKAPRFLGPTAKQLEALTHLAKALREHCGVPLAVPDASPGGQRLETLSQVEATPGWVHHAEVKPGKWDHAGVRLADIMHEARRL